MEHFVGAVMKVINFWAVVVCGGKTNNDLAYFSSQLAAESFSKGIDCRGDDGLVEERQIILFADSMEAHNTFTGEEA